MIVKVYMSCCGGDKDLETVSEAVRLSGTGAQVVAVSDMIEIAKAGIMSTPAIAIDGRIVARGRTPKVQEIVTLLATAAGDKKV